MKTKSNKKQNKSINANDLRQVFDLFGEVVVTHDDVIAWCKAVPKIEPTSWRFNWYVKNWDVVNKIRWHKRKGLFEQAINNA